MNIRIQTRNPRSGKVLLIVMVITVMLGMLAASYLTLQSNANYNVLRSQSWNQTIPLVEAGIEDALTHLNVHGTTNLACDGWSGPSNNLYWLQRKLPGGSYLVTLSNYVAGSTVGPTIESRGFVELPSTLSASPQPSLSQPFMLAAAGVNVSPKRSYVARGVRVTTAKNSAFPGLFVKYGFEMQNTTGLMADSYDSTKSAYSTGGKYDASKRMDHTYMGTISRSAGAMNIHQTAEINGSVGGGASGVCTVYSPAVVGSEAFCNAAGNGGKIQAGHLFTGVNIPFPEVQAPFSGGYLTSAPGDTVDGVSYAYVLNGGNYKISSVSLSSTKLLVKDDTVLWVNSMSLNSGQIIIKPGKTLKLYVSTGFTASGDTKVNADGRPIQFQYFGMPLNESFQITGNSYLCGAFYSTRCTAQFQNNSVLCGAGMFYDFQAQHNFQFHYDESLGSATGALYMVNSWNEMSPSAVGSDPNRFGVQQ